MLKKYIYICNSNIYILLVQIFTYYDQESGCTHTKLKLSLPSFTLVITISTSNHVQLSNIWQLKFIYFYLNQSLESASSDLDLFDMKSLVMIFKYLVLFLFNIIFLMILKFSRIWIYIRTIWIIRKRKPFFFFFWFFRSSFKQLLTFIMDFSLILISMNFFLIVQEESVDR